MHAPPPVRPASGTLESGIAPQDWQPIGVDPTVVSSAAIWRSLAALLTFPLSAQTQQSCHQGQSSGTPCLDCAYALWVPVFDALVRLSVISHFRSALRNQPCFGPIFRLGSPFEGV